MQVDKMNQMKICPACKSTSGESFFEVEGMPIFCNVLWPSAEAAIRCRRGDIKLVFCPSCGLVYNSAFDLTLLEYGQDYENSLHFSPRFQEFATSLAADLVKKHDLHGKQLVEIGCGDGDFLSMLCELGENTGTGFDPSVNPTKEDLSANQRVTLVPDYLDARHKHLDADFIACRHVLEHVERPVQFLNTIRELIGERATTLYFEVPNLLFTLRDMAIWDIIYEHCLYFQPGALVRLFADSGFRVLEIHETFERQFIGIEAAVGAAKQSVFGDFDADAHLAQTRDYIATFVAGYRAKFDKWRKTFAEMERQRKKAVVWGGGSKGVTFLNVLEPSAVKYLLDINPRKHGKHVAGTGQQIVPPSFLIEHQPDVVIIMNRVYEGEIQQTLTDLAISPQIIVDDLNVD